MPGNKFDIRSVKYVLENNKTLIQGKEKSKEMKRYAIFMV